MKDRISVKIDGRIRKEVARKYRKKIISALDLLSKIELSQRENDVLGLLLAIHHCAHLGSAVNLRTRVFYVGKGLLAEASVEYLASSIVHDSYHLYQYQKKIDGYECWFQRGKLSLANQTSIEQGAIQFQIRFNQRLNLRAHERKHLRKFLQQPNYFKGHQRFRKW